MSTGTEVSVEQEGQSLRNRFDRFPKFSQTSTEELLVERLDIFLSSIESRLDNFEQFFKFKSSEQEKLGESEKLAPPSNHEQRSRRSSAASLNSIRTFSTNYLNQIHQRLDVVKDSVLRSSFTNLDYLFKTLDDQYNYLFAQHGIDAESSQDTTELDKNAESHKEILSQKIITTIQYFDEKLSSIDDFIKDNKPAAKTEYDTDSINHLRFYNFNKALKSAESSYIHYYQLPLSWRENKYIIEGYRFSLKHSSMLRSVFQFNHNESMNIWTHLIGFFVMVYIVFWHFPSTQAYLQHSHSEKLALYGFFAAAVNCLLSSAVWHTYSCFANITTRARCACVDYSGITVLITFSVISAQYCALYHYPKLLKVFVAFSGLCGLTGFGFNWSPYFDKPECRSLRIGFFVGLAFMGVTASFCMMFYEGFLPTFLFFVPMAYKSFVWYWLGVVFYGGLIPERWRYDVIIEDDNSSCSHDYNTNDVLLDKVDKSGEDEIEEIEEQLVRERSRTNVLEDNKIQGIIDKHFPESPTHTPYYRDFLSLWWVDYFMSSHNIWHICVVLGIIGHYLSVLDMYDSLDLVK